MQKKIYRPFQISCGLREGYDLSSIVHTINEARQIIQDWFERRTKSNLKVAVGILVEGQLIYPWIEGDDISSRYEPAFHYKGMIREDASDTEAKDMLFDLAQEFIQKLKQQRIHIEFSSEYFIIES